MGYIKVLLVDDSKTDQMAFKRMVKENNLNYHFITASSVKECKKVLKEYSFDIVILDYMLGDGTAFDLFGDVRETPFIITTGQGDEEIAVNAIKSGAYDYLIKDPDFNYMKILPITIQTAIRYKEENDLLIMLSYAVMSISDSVFITDMLDRIIFVNRAFCETYGYSKDEIFNKHINILWKKEGLFKETRERGIVRRDYKGETKNRRKDGSELEIYLSRSVIIDENDNEIAVVGIARDITERKRMEEEQNQCLLDLKKALAEIKSLSGLLPICAACKKVRDDKGYWKQVEVYIKEHTDAIFTHGLCPDCAKKSFPQLDPKLFDGVFEDE